VREDKVRRGIGRVFAYAVFGVAGVLVLIVLVARPWECYTIYECRYCHATTTRHWVFFIELPAPVQETKMTRYWRKHVDPSHVHSYRYTHKVNAGLGREGVDNLVASDTYWWFPNRERRAIAILKSLPTPAARRAMVEKCLPGKDWDLTIDRHLSPAIRKKYPFPTSCGKP
jgi:hypothetical protein